MGPTPSRRRLAGVAIVVNAALRCGKSPRRLWSLAQTAGELHRNVGDPLAKLRLKRMIAAEARLC